MGKINTNTYLAIQNTINSNDTVVLYKNQDILRTIIILYANIIVFIFEVILLLLIDNPTPWKKIIVGIIILFTLYNILWNSIRKLNTLKRERTSIIQNTQKKLAQLDKLYMAGASEKEILKELELLPKNE